MVVHMPLPVPPVSVRGKTTGPFTPRCPAWIWACVPAISAVTMVAFIARVVGSITTRPVPEPAVFTGGASSEPESVAENTFRGTELFTEFTWLTAAVVGLTGSSSLPQPAITSMDSAAIHQGVDSRE